MFFPRATDGYKPRVATYIHASLLSVVSILPLIFKRDDLMAVNFHSPEGIFDSAHNLFCLYNAYSIPSGHQRSVCPVDLFPQHDFPTLVLGDLNIHPSTSHPAHFLTTTINSQSPPIVTETQLYLSLSSTPQVSTPGSPLPPPAPCSS